MKNVLPDITVSKMFIDIPLAQNKPIHGVFRFENVHLSIERVLNFIVFKPHPGVEGSDPGVPQKWP